MAKAMRNMEFVPGKDGLPMVDSNGRFIMIPVKAQVEVWRSGWVGGER